MTPVFANSATITVRERLLLKGGRSDKVGLRVRYGILQHPTAGTVLIDTGYGPTVMAADARLSLRLYNRLMGARLAPPDAMDAALAQCGTSRAAVAGVIVTHFHADHVSELAAFPKARIYASGAALQQVQTHSRLANLRHGVFPELVPDDAAARLTDVDHLAQVTGPLGLGAVGDLFGDGSVLTVPLPGHAAGHFGLCFPSATRPLLYAVDAQWIVRAATQARLPGFPASLVAEDGAALAASAQRVAAFHAAGGEVMTCHDPARTDHDLREAWDV